MGWNMASLAGNLLFTRDMIQHRDASVTMLFCWGQAVFSLQNCNPLCSYYEVALAMSKKYCWFHQDQGTDISRGRRPVERVFFPWIVCILVLMIPAVFRLIRFMKTPLLLLALSLHLALNQSRFVLRCLTQPQGFMPWCCLPPAECQDPFLLLHTAILHWNLPPHSNKSKPFRNRHMSLHPCS